MVNLTRIYTKTGDDGATALGDFSRTSKTDSRLVAYADVDEANCALGLVLALGGDDLSSEVASLLLRIQNDLFDVGADLCTPLDSEKNIEAERLRITDAYVVALEEACDHYNAALAPLRSFILPGGTVAASFLHQARAVVRRAERSTWAAMNTYPDSVNPLTAKYLNRLSDLLFILSRVANNGQDVLWRPGGEMQR